MMMKPTEIIATTAIFASAVVLTGVLATASVNATPDSQPVDASAFARATEDKAGDRVARGKYFVDIMRCHDENRVPQPIDPPEPGSAQGGQR